MVERAPLEQKTIIRDENAAFRDKKLHGSYTEVAAMFLDEARPPIKPPRDLVRFQAIGLTSRAGDAR